MGENQQGPCAGPGSARRLARIQIQRLFARLSAGSRPRFRYAASFAASVEQNRERKRPARRFRPAKLDPALALGVLLGALKDDVPLVGRLNFLQAAADQAETVQARLEILAEPAEQS